MPRPLLLSMALALTPALFTSACSADPADPAAEAAVKAAQWPFTATETARFNEPWAMTFLPDGSALITEKAGKLIHFDPASGKRGEISGIPAVAYGGQGGLGDVVVHPQFASNGWIYYSYAEEGEGDTRGAAVARAKLELDASGGGQLSDAQVIWRQTPKVSGRGHYGHRLAFGPDGKLWISSSERQKFDPAQDMKSNLGKIIRINDDGSIPADNPFVAQGSPADQVWSLGHRSVLGLAFDAHGKLWEHEMGPKGGDELNLIQRGGNYGYPIVSNGDHYDGRPIPDHDTRPEFIAPVVTWRQVISPAGFIIYSGTQFPQWQGSGFIGGLSSKSLVRVAFDGDKAREAERFDMGNRIREVEQGPDGALWLLEDGSDGRLLKLTPKAG
ncbi:glucose dehydrogenase [Stenotrophomonas humi]|uniref:Glucose dehydrogenase n=1 Tax=Stenotrophomonas humi TaxID=405444 RepID=A0A0R0C2Q9_9GAMM|nr:PQQ-dependent sugar dehydrogenase [Stenotrophomonas humi]KRG64175.1 glucose dehydrogenase [Stenotrophomonas humi]